MSYQNVIDTILRGGSDAEIIEAALQQTRYDSGHALQMMAAARGSGTIATVISLDPIVGFESADGQPIAIAAFGTVIPATTGVLLTLLQSGIPVGDGLPAVPVAGRFQAIFNNVAVGTNYQVQATVPGIPDFTPVLSNIFEVIDISIMQPVEPLPELKPDLTYAPVAQPEGARVV